MARSGTGDPHRQRRWLKWVLILVLIFSVVAFLAVGAFNSYLSSSQIKSQANAELVKSLPGWTLDFKAAGVGLSGALPRLAFSVQDLVVRGEHSCFDWLLRTTEAKVHITWRGLLKGFIQIAHVTLGDIELDLSDLQGCKMGSPQLDSAQAPQTPKPPAPLPKAPAKKTPTVPDKEPKGLAVPAPRVALFEELAIDRARINYRQQTVVFSELSTGPYFPDRELEVQGQILFEVQGNRSLRFPKVRFSAKVAPERVQWASKGSWREGDIAFQGEWNRGRIQVKGDLQHIPLSPAVNLFVHYGLWKKELNYQSAWLSCQIEVKGELKPMELAAEFRSCQIEGEIGNLKIGDTRVLFRPESQLQMQAPVLLDLKKVHVDKVLNVLDIDVLGGVLADFGFVEAQVRIDPSGQSELIGEIKDVSFAFSNKGVAGRQRVPSVRGKVFFDGERVSGQLLEMELKNGEFEGGLSFNFNRHFTEGAMQIGVPRLTFDPTIQRLLTGGELSSLALFGKMLVKDNRLLKWEGNIGTDRIANLDYELEKLKASYRFEDRALFLDIRSEKGLISTSSPIFLFLEPAFLVRDFTEEKVSWEKLRSELTIEEKSLFRWKNTQVSMDENRIALKSDGELGRESLAGKVVVQLPGFKPIQWDLAGTEQKPLMTPNYKSLKELAKQRQKSSQPN